MLLAVVLSSVGMMKMQYWLRRPHFSTRLWQAGFCAVHEPGVVEVRKHPAQGGNQHLRCHPRGVIHSEIVQSAQTAASGDQGFCWRRRTLQDASAVSTCREPAYESFPGRAKLAAGSQVRPHLNGSNVSSRCLAQARVLHLDCQLPPIVCYRPVYLSWRRHESVS